MYVQTIDPSCVEVGDTIKVLHYKQLGMELSITGTVALREEFNDIVLFCTEEHGILLSYQMGKSKAVTVFLIHRQEIKQETLSFFDMDNEELVARFAD